MFKRSDSELYRYEVSKKVDRYEKSSDNLPNLEVQDNPNLEVQDNSSLKEGASGSILHSDWDYQTTKLVEIYNYSNQE